jgi:hypothetical protein
MRMTKNKNTVEIECKNVTSAKKMFKFFNLLFSNNNISIHFSTIEFEEDTKLDSKEIDRYTLLKANKK